MRILIPLLLPLSAQLDVAFPALCVQEVVFDKCKCRVIGAVNEAKGDQRSRNHNVLMLGLNQNCPSDEPITVVIIMYL